MQLLFKCQPNLGNNLMGHPVNWFKSRITLFLFSTLFLEELLRHDEQRPPVDHRDGGPQRRRVRPALAQTNSGSGGLLDGSGRGRSPQLRERLDVADDVALDKDPDSFALC